MLKALYDYALREDLILPAGYVNKNVRAYVSLSKDGKFLGILPGQEEKVFSSRAIKNSGRNTPSKPRTFGKPWRMLPKRSPG